MVKIVNWFNDVCLGLFWQKENFWDIVGAIEIDYLIELS